MDSNVFIFHGTEGYPEKFVDKIEGSESNIAGLPIEEVMETLKEFDIVV